MKHVFLLDITEHEGPVQDVVRPAQAYMSSFNPEITKWYATADQKTKDGLAGFDVVEVNGSSALAQIVKTIDALKEDGYVFHVLSYGRSVLLGAARLNSPDTVVGSLSLTVLAHPQRLPSNTRALSGIRPPSYSAPILPRPGVFRSTEASASLSLMEAVRLTRQILEQRGHNSAENGLPQMQLRPLLNTATEGRARRNPNDPRSGSLISDIVRTGRAEGWLEQVTRDGQSGTERIFLKAPSKPVPQSTNIVAPPAVAVEPINRSRARTLEMIKCLKDRYVYSPKDIRDLFFAALEEMSQNLAKEPMKVGALLFAAMNKSKESAQTEGMEYKYWSAAGDAILEMMLAASVLKRADGTTLQPSSHARAELVSSIAPNFVDGCEMFLLEYLIKKLGNVTVRDRTALAHALLKVSPKKKQVFELYR